MRYSDFKIVETAPTDANDPRGPDQRNDPNASTEETGLQAGPPYPQEDTQAVRALQTKLQALGYSVGTTGIDGKYGPRTTAAVRSYKKDFDVSGDGMSMSADEITAMQSAEPKENPTPVQGNTAAGPSGGGGAAAVGGQPGSLEGTNVLASNTNERQLPNQNIIDALDRAASERGIQVQITPNGGRAGRDTGTQNHPPGEAADIQIVQGGRVIRPGDNRGLYDDLIQTLVTNAARRGVRPGIGGYSWGIHYDESGWRQGGDDIAGKWGSSFIQTGIDAARQGLA